MKKIIILFVILIFLTGCSAEETDISINTTQPFIENNEEAYVKSVFITYYELADLIAGKNEAQFTKAVYNTLNKLENMGFNTVTLQVRAFSDAFYKSDYFPVSKYCFGKQGSELKYDILEVFCSQAEKTGIKVQAWINPYRVSSDSDIDKLSDNNPAKKWYKNKKKKSNVYISESGIYYNPACDDVNTLIINGVKEIVENYNISAICIDDYFYPEKNKEIDSFEYEKYKSSGGKMTLSDFRRDRVSNTVKSINKAVKEVNQGIEFIISPAADIKSNYENQYANVEEWAKNTDYCDYICPQVYFGFKNVYKPFMFTVKKWVGLTSVGLYIGLPLYKAGKADKYAAKEDKEAINEFKNNQNIIARQINYLAKLDDIKGIYIFSYSSVFDEKNSKETENMIKALQSKNPR